MFNFDHWLIAGAQQYLALHAKRIEYRAEGDLSGLPDDGLDEDETIEDLISLIHVERESVRKALQIYETAPILPAAGGGAFE